MVIVSVKEVLAVVCDPVVLFVCVRVDKVVWGSDIVVIG